MAKAHMSPHTRTAQTLSIALSVWTGSLTLAQSDSPLSPCQHFGAALPQATFFISLEANEREVQLRVPFGYLGAHTEHYSGVRRGSQLFTVMLDGFAPATEIADSSNEIVSFLVGDFMDVSSVAAAILNPGARDTAQTSDHLVMTSVGLFGLTKLSLTDDPDGRHVLRNIDGMGQLSAIIDCPTGTNSPKPMCSHYFTAHGLSVISEYPAHRLTDWRRIQDDVEAFLGCATKG